MKKYEVWSEGYAVTGNTSVAQLNGTIEAENFKDACDKLFKDEKLYNSEKLTYWGCNLYDNEQDARKSFG